MSRRKRKPTHRVQVPIKRLDAIVEQTRSAPLGEDDHATLKAAVDTLARLTEELETTTTTLERVRRLIFGPRSERTDTVLGKDRPEGDAPPDTGTDPGGAGEATAGGDTPAKKPRTGHGRNGAEDYPRASRSPIPPSSTATPVPNPTVADGSTSNARSPRSWCASPAWRPCRRRSRRWSGCAAGCAARCLPLTPRRGWARRNTMRVPRP
jgi:hypothetical protein